MYIWSKMPKKKQTNRGRKNNRQLAKVNMNPFVTNKQTNRKVTNKK